MNGLAAKETEGAAVPAQEMGLALFPSEAPPQVFISSVMGPEADPYRKEAINAVKTVANLQPWAFEYTSASSEDPRAVYLRKVRESVIVIWLATKTTTEPVQAEVREALASGRRLLVFKLLQEGATTETESLLAEVQQHVKWTATAGVSSLGEALRLALCDEVSRALQQPRPAADAEQILSEEWRLTISRCVERWISLQVPRAVATEMALDQAIGASIQSLATDGVTVLTGEVGIGKSLALERNYQKALQEFRADRSTPIPLFLDARAVATSLRETTESKAKALGIPSNQGVRAFIDRADEQGERKLASLLQQARILVGAWPKTGIAIASRPLPLLARVDERKAVPTLNFERAAALISKIAEHRMHPLILGTLSPPIREAITRPLFAIIYANCLRRNIARMPQSEGELLDELAEQAIGRVSDRVRASRALRHLASLSVRRDSAPVHVGDIPDQEELRLCCQTGVVVQKGKIVEFPLLVLAHWFAAEALIEGGGKVEPIAGSLAEAERWRYPLTIAVAKLCHADATRLLAPIVESQPAFASQIVRSAILNTTSVEDYSLPPAIECGENLRAAVNHWAKAIGPLARTFSPLRNRPELPPMAVARQKQSLGIAWYSGTDDLPAIIEGDALADDFVKRDWPSKHWSVIGRQPAWAWLWSLDMLAQGVADAVKKRALRVPIGPIHDELLWQSVLELVHRGGLTSEPIPLEEIEMALACIPDGQVRVLPTRMATDSRTIRGRLAELKEDGAAAWPPPTPGRDQEQGAFAWSAYSEQGLLEKTVAVFEKAITAYGQMIDTWFSAFRDRMEHAVTLPARVVGVVIPSKGSDIHDMPAVSWHFEPLPRCATSEVALELGDKPVDRSDLRDQFKALSAARPEAIQWISAWQENSVLDIFNATPVTSMVYTWIERDLKKIGWMK